MALQTILVEKIENIGLIRINRPEALNALNAQVAAEVSEALDDLEADDAIGCVVVTGSERAFAAGADIKEMADKTYAEVMREDLFVAWERLPRF